MGQAERPVPATTRIIYQPYIKGMKPGTPVVCRDPAEGERRAEKAMAGGSILGAQVVRVTIDEDAGDYGEPEYLFSIGAVPAAE
jgi:hypothetical protein